MSETSTVYVLMIILVFFTLMSTNYSQWVNQQNIMDENVECNEIISTNWISGEKYISGVECEGDIPQWFNAIWIVPLGVALIYAVIPFIKG